MDPGATSTQLKCLHITERVGSRKKVNASNLAIDPITLIEGDLHDIGKTVYDVTNETLQEFIQKHQTMLRSLKA